jgi:hypothetical protein
VYAKTKKKDDLRLVFTRTQAMQHLYSSADLMFSHVANVSGNTWRPIGVDIVAVF